MSSLADEDNVQASEESIATTPEAESAKEAAEVIEEATDETATTEAAQAEGTPNGSESVPVEEPKAEEKKEAKPVSKDLEKIIESIEKLSVLELADLVHALEDRFGVTAAAPMAVASGTAPAASGEASGEEQTTFNVILTSGGANKIAVIKAVRELVPTLGLKEAKDLVEGAPKPVLEGVNKETANEAKTKLTAAGGTVELQ